MGVFHPDKTSDKRYIFNYAHRGLGFFSFVLASVFLSILFSLILFIIFFLVVALFLGVLIKKMNIDTVGWRVLTGWLVWIFYFIIQIEIIDHYLKKANTVDPGKIIFVIIKLDFILRIFYLFVASFEIGNDKRLVSPKNNSSCNVIINILFFSNFFL